MNHIENYLKRCLLLFGLLFLFVHPLQAAEWGTLSGQFIYTGKLFHPKQLEITKDKIICGKPGNKKIDESLVIGKDGGIKNIFVYLRAPKLKDAQIHSSYQKLPEKIFVQNKNCTIKPHALGLWHKHQKLIAINKDPLAHNFHLNLIKNQPACSLWPPNRQRKYEFYTKEPLPVKIVCDIHPWETAYLLIKDHPYFAVTDDKGAFTIKNLPVGEWEFQLWHEKVGYLVAKEEWKRGRIKMKIEPGNNDLGEIKVAPKLFEE